MRALDLRRVIPLLILTWVLTGCSTYQPVEAKPPQVELSAQISSLTPVFSTGDPFLTPSPVNPVTPSPTFTPTVEATTDPLPQPDQAISCEEDWCVYPGHFWLSQPVASGQIDHTYRYGGTQQYARETHHGVEFIDAYGTPVIAAADGTVIVAGSDRITNYGLYKGFYGNVVIIEHQSPYSEQKIYTLYGHLSEIDVQVGDQILRGQKIGNVGSAGAALGSHLHFEVRLGTNSYLTTCNPELWLLPNVDPLSNVQDGAIAVRMMDGSTPIYTFPVTIEYYPDPEGPVTNIIYTESYAWNTPNSSIWQEQLAVNNLVPGLYRVSFIRQDRWFRELVTISPGQLTVVNFNAQ